MNIKYSALLPERDESMNSLSQYFHIKMFRLRSQQKKIHNFLKYGWNTTHSIRESTCSPDRYVNYPVDMRNIRLSMRNFKLWHSGVYEHRICAFSFHLVGAQLADYLLIISSNLFLVPVYTKFVNICKS